MRPKTRSLFVIFVGAASHALVACAVLEPVDLVDAQVDARPDAQVDGGFDAQIDAELDICSPRAAIPPKPRIAGEGDAVEFTVVFRTVDLGEGEDAGVPDYIRFGYDLDETCTTSATTASCERPIWARDWLDGPGGRDITFGTLVHRLNTTGQGSSNESANSTTAMGNGTAALRVRNYNGASLDRKVEVAMFGVTRVQPDAFDAGGIPPEWDGQDVWHTFDLWAANFDAVVEDGADVEPVYVVEDAYVLDDILVARFPNVLVSLGLLSQAVVTARIERVGERLTLTDGMVAGRLPIDDLLATLEPSFVCTDSPMYTESKRRLCAMADISTEGPDDGTAACDGVSIGWKFEAEPAAKIQGALPSAPIFPPHCEDDVSPAHDSCSTLTEPPPADAGLDAN